MAARVADSLRHVHPYRVNADTRCNEGISPKFCIYDARPLDRPEVSSERKDVMRNTTCSKVNCAIYRRIAEIQLSDADRQRARYALRDADLVKRLCGVGLRVLAYTVNDPAEAHRLVESRQSTGKVVLIP